MTGCVLELLYAYLFHSCSLISIFRVNLFTIIQCKYVWVTGTEWEGRKVVVTVVDPETKIRNQILESDVRISELGEEITVFRFTLDDKGTLDQSSINNDYIQLRSGQK